MAPDPNQAFMETSAGPATAAVSAANLSAGSVTSDKFGHNWAGTTYVTNNTNSPGVHFKFPEPTETTKELSNVQEYKLGNGKSKEFVVKIAYVNWPQIDAYKVEKEYDEHDDPVAEILTEVEARVEYDRIAQSVTVEFEEAPARNAVTLVVR